MMTEVTRAARLAAALILLSGALPLTAAAAPTPMPGGANQMNGITGTLQTNFFNGQLRFHKFMLRTSTPAERTPDPGGMALTLSYLVAGGVAKHMFGNVTASIVDADGVELPSTPVGVYGGYFDVDPGATARGNLTFSLTPGFVPVKILVKPPVGPALRINLKKSDVPAWPAPAPAPSAT